MWKLWVATSRPARFVLQYRMDRRRAEPKSLSGYCDKDKNVHPCRESNSGLEDRGITYRHPICQRLCPYPASCQLGTGSRVTGPELNILARGWVRRALPALLLFFLTCLTTYRVQASTFLSNVTRFRYGVFLKVPRFGRFGLFVLQANVACRWRWVWSIGGMKLTGENGSTLRNTCSSATSSTTILTGLAWGRTRKHGSKNPSYDLSFNLYRAVFGLLQPYI